MCGRWLEVALSLLAAGPPSLMCHEEVPCAIFMAEEIEVPGPQEEEEDRAACIEVFCLLLPSTASGPSFTAGG